MRQLNPLFEMNELEPDFEFEARVLERNNREAELLNKKGYRIKEELIAEFLQEFEGKSEET